MRANQDSRDGAVPVIPLPNLGEGGPVDAGDGGVPVIPLPNPGEGGPVDAGDGGVPVIPLPNPGEGGPVDAGDGGVPVIPLPNPGEGGPVAPGPTLPPCYTCGTARTGNVRFLNAANDYPSFRVYVQNRLVANGLSFASITPYSRIASGYQKVTVTGYDGYIYLQKTMPVRANESATLAIIRTLSGLDLIQISDTPCQRTNAMSCFRVANLAYNSNPLDVLLRDGRVVFGDVRYKEVTAAKRIRPGSYQFYLAETDFTPIPRDEDIETLGIADASVIDATQALLSFYVQVQRGVMCTAFILSRGRTADALQVLVIEDRLS